MKNMNYNAIGLELNVEDKRNDNYYNDVVYNGYLKVEVKHMVAETPIGNINLEKQVINVPLNDDEIRVLQEVFNKATKRIAKEKEITISRKGTK